MQNRRKDKMIPLDEAFRIMAETIRPLENAGEILPTHQACGRTLLSDLVSRVEMPPFNKSAMDGYAVLANDLRSEYRLLETIAAGEVGSEKLVPGAAVKIMTGAPTPPGTGRVIMVEETTEENGIVKIREDRLDRLANAPANICLRAEDVKIGQLILSKGRRLNSTATAVLLGCGVTKAHVGRPVRLAIVTTGNELVDALSPACLEDLPKFLTAGKIVNTNGPLLAGLARESGMEVVSSVMVGDQLADLKDAVETASRKADITLFSGGVSMGDFDLVPQAITESGFKILFSRVAVKPGKPMTFAYGRGKIIFGLPGNPVSARLMFLLFVLRAVTILYGLQPREQSYKVRLVRDFTRPTTNRLEFVPARIDPEGGIRTVRFHGSAHLAALVEADGFMVVPKGVKTYRSGEEVAFLPLEKQREL